MKSLKDQVAELDISKSHIFDPEALEDFGPQTDEESSDDEIEPSFDGREHYENVGKSKLRISEQPVLGTQYKGAIISRDALADEDQDDPLAPVDEDDDEDPFARRERSESDVEDPVSRHEGAENTTSPDIEDGEDEEIDSEEAFGESDAEKFKDFKFLGSRRANRPSGDGASEEEAPTEKVSEDESDEGSQDAEVEEFESDSEQDYEESDNDLSEANSTTSPETQPELAPLSERDKFKSIASKDDPESIDRGKLNSILAESAPATVASSLAAAASNEAKKGRAVKQQHQTFDKLLDTRIKLQKGLTASNELDLSSISDDEANTAIRKAEDAALSLWTTIESLRLNIQSHIQPTKKRNAPSPVTSETSTTDLLKRMQSLESTALPHCRAILNKWSAKTRPPTPQSSKSKVHIPTPTEDKLTSYLDTHLAANTNIDTSSHNDTMFYQSLLRELISHRSAISTSIAADPLPAKLHNPTNTTKKAVDTKASKGRKIRYTVHDKLQNFAAPEDRSTWTESARREFFGSLLGQSGMLAEADGEDEEMADVDGGEVEVEALKLFRN